MSKTFAHSQIFMPVLKKLATVYLTKEKVFGKISEMLPFLSHLAAGVCLSGFDWQGTSQQMCGVASYHGQTVCN